MLERRYLRNSRSITALRCLIYQPVIWGTSPTHILSFLSAQCVSSIGQIIKSVCVSVSESVSQSFREFWYPSISRERLKLETSNLAHRLATGGLNEKMQN